MSTGEFGVRFRPLQRDRSVTLSEQLRGTVQLAVLRGELAEGASLPSVRLLASALGVSRGTVLRAYEELEREGLVISRARRGFFAAVAGQGATRAPQHKVESLIDEAIRAASSIGVEGPRFLQIVASRVQAQRRTRGRVIVVGYREAALEERAGVIRRGIQDLDAEVTALSWEELGTAAGMATAAGGDWYIVPVLETREAAGLLRAPSERIVPMTRMLRPDVREFIRAQRPRTRFGILAGRDEFVGRLLAAVKNLHPLRGGALTALAADADGVRTVLENSDVLVVGPLARAQLKAFEPLPLPNIDLIYLPDPQTVKRLRLRLGSARD